MPNIKLNDFVRRQTPESPFSHFDGTEEQLVSLTETGFSHAKPGYKDGVLLVEVMPWCGEKPNRFWASTAKLSQLSPGTELKARYEARKEGEEPVLSVVAEGRKVPAKAVFIVLYRHDVLSADASTDAEWEIVSINARVHHDEEPMPPVTMARNFLEKAGGTKGDFTAQQFAESIWFWAQHVLIEPKK